MCYPPSDCIMFSLRELNIYGGQGPGAGNQITPTPFANGFCFLKLYFREYSLFSNDSDGHQIVPNFRKFDFKKLFFVLLLS